MKESLANHSNISSYRVTQILLCFPMSTFKARALKLTSVVTFLTATWP